jgi:type III secretion protein W
MSQVKMDAGPGLAGLSDQITKGQEEKGRLAGYEIKASADPLELLADSSEELTFGHDNTKELDLKERKVKDSRFDLMVEKVAKYQELMAKSGHKTNLERLAEFLKSNRNPRDVLDQALKEFGGDPSLAWAALEELQADLAGSAEISAALKTAADELESRRGPEIKAGLAGTLAGLDHPGLGDPFELGSDYRRATGEFYERPEDMFAFILEKFGPERFEEAVEFLFRSLGDDLASDQPSHGPAHLEAVGQGLGQVRVLNGAHALALRLVERWRSVHQVTEASLTPMELVQSLLRAKSQRFPGPDDYRPLLQSAKPPDIEREVLFYQELLGTVRLFSPQFFDGPESRLKVMGSVQEALDLAITREDEYLASLE